MRFYERKTGFPSRSEDSVDAYLSGLADAEPLDRESEVAAAKRIEAAELRSLEVLLDAGVLLPELEAFESDLKNGRRKPKDVLRDSGAGDEVERRKLVRRLAEIRRLGERCVELEALLKERGLSAKRRKALREELAALRERRSRRIIKLSLDRDRVEEIVARVEQTIRRAMSTDAETAQRAARQLGRPPHTLRKTYRELYRARVEQDRAKTHLTQANLRLVVSMAKKFRNRGVPFSDLIQEGNLGLMRAVDKFDHRVGTRFSTYAAWWIRQAVARLVICQGRDIRVPIHMTDTIRRVRSASRDITARLGRDPTVDEIADELDCTVEKVRAALGATPRTHSLDAPLGEDDGDGRLGDLLADDELQSADDAVMTLQNEERTRELLELLDTRERRILTLRFGFEGEETRTLQEIGNEMGLSRERIRQLEAEALGKLRRALARGELPANESSEDEEPAAA